MHWDYWRLLAIVSIAGFIGLLCEQMALFMFLAAFGYALWLQRAWYQLAFWLNNSKKYTAPHANGVINNVCQKITARRLQNRTRQRKLADSLKSFHSVTTALPDALVVVGEQGEVEGANPAAKHLLGIYWPEDHKRRLTNLIRDPAFQPLMDKPVNDNDVVIVKSPLNPRIQLEMKIVNYMDARRLVVARDMTQTVKLQKMRRDFVANASHELRTPLTVLHGYLSMFNFDSSQEQWKEVLPVMLKQADRMQNMITDLLALSQLETDEKPSRHSEVNVAELLDIVVDDAHRLANYDNHQIQIIIDTDRAICGDRDELHSALSNLVFNAVKYTPAGCKITLGWHLNNGHAELYVNDEGEGIAEHHLERLTERFYRVDSSRAEQSEGTGLGLAIVKHVLERHDAELNISSELGLGSQFYCRFPLHRTIAVNNEHYDKHVAVA